MCVCVCIYTVKNVERRLFLRSVHVISKLPECPFAFQLVVYLRTKFKQHISDLLPYKSTPRKMLNSINERCSSAPWTFNDRLPMMTKVIFAFCAQISATYTQLLSPHSFSRGVDNFFLSSFILSLAVSINYMIIYYITTKIRYIKYRNFLWYMCNLNRKIILWSFGKKFSRRWMKFPKGEGLLLYWFRVIINNHDL